MSKLATKTSPELLPKKNQIGYNREDKLYDKEKRRKKWV